MDLSIKLTMGAIPVIDIIGAVPLRELSAPTVRSALKDLAATRATRTVGMTDAGLTRAIRHAEVNDKVRRNVATLVDTPTGQEGRPSKSLTLGQAVALIRAARPYGLYAYRQRETVFATIMADRADWDAATRAQRHLGVAADAELRRRHPDQHFFPLRSAEPEPATESQRAELTLTEGQRPGEMGQWITDLAAAHRTFAERLADRQSLTIPAEDSRYGDLG